MENVIHLHNYHKEISLNKYIQKLKINKNIHLNLLKKHNLNVNTTIKEYKLISEIILQVFILPKLILKHVIKKYSKNMMSLKQVVCLKWQELLLKLI